MKTIGILSMGEMGQSVARVLGEHGVRVLTALEGRSAETRGRAQAVGVEDAGSVADLVGAVDTVLSIVVSSAAPSVGHAVAEAIRATGKPVLLAEMNSISPMTTEAIGAEVTKAGGRFVDGCIIGSAANLGRASFIFSGPEASSLTGLSEHGLRTEVLSDVVGQASGLKMVYAGMTKGVASLGLELLLLARSLGIVEPLIERYRGTFGDMVTFLEGSLPGYPARAVRRAEEMEELVRTMEHYAMSPHMARGTEQRLAWLGGLKLDTDGAGGLAEVVEAVHARSQVAARP